MIGKTNLTFISKGDASSVQLLQKSYVIGMAGEIYKMEEINGRLFVFGNGVMMGDNIDNLDFLKKDGVKLQATHIIYADERYYIVNHCRDWNEKIYLTCDFQTYEEIDPVDAAGISREIMDGTVKKTAMITSMNLFLDSKGRIIFIYLYDWYSANNTPPVNYTGAEHAGMSICKSLKEVSEREMIELSGDAKSSYGKSAFLADDKIYCDRRQIDLNGGADTSYEILYKRMYANGYFFRMITAGSENIIYRSRDGKNLIRGTHETPGKDFEVFDSIVPINGKLGVICYNQSEFKTYLNIANDVMSVGDVGNEMVQIFDSFNIVSIVEYNEKTYIGTDNGTIYELQLDYDGILQRPDVAIIKTLAAKQALAQAMQYTDDCIAKLKGYIDGKIEKESSDVENNSTKVES